MNTIANTVVNAITTFTKIVEVESQQAAQFDMPIKDFIREVMRASVAAKTDRAAWSKEGVLRGLLTASHGYWARKSTAMFGEACKKARNANDHKELVTIMANELRPMVEAYEDFAKKQFAVITALRAKGGISPFIKLRLVICEGSSIQKSFSYKDLQMFLVGAGDYDVNTRFNQEDARRFSSYERIQFDVAGLRGLMDSMVVRDSFLTADPTWVAVGTRAWDWVLEGIYTKQRRVALMNMDKVTSRTNDPAWDEAVAHMKESLRYNVTNGDIHHLLGALMVQFSFSATLNLRRMQTEIEQHAALIEREDNAPWSANNANRGVWAGSAVRKDGTILTEQYGVWKRDHDAMVDEMKAFADWAQDVEAALIESNKPLEGAFGELSYKWVATEGADGKRQFIKITDRAQAMELRDAQWQAKRDAEAEAKRDRELPMLLKAIEGVLTMSFIDTEVDDAE